MESRWAPPDADRGVGPASSDSRPRCPAMFRTHPPRATPPPLRRAAHPPSPHAPRTPRAGVTRWVSRARSPPQEISLDSISETQLALPSLLHPPKIRAPSREVIKKPRVSSGTRHPCHMQECAHLSTPRRGPHDKLPSSALEARRTRSSSDFFGGASWLESSSCRWVGNRFLVASCRGLAAACGVRRNWSGIRYLSQN